MEARVNQSITKWEMEESELEVMPPTGIQSHLEKVSWETMAMVGGGRVGLFIFVIGGNFIIMAVQSSKRPTTGGGVVVIRRGAKNQLALEFDQQRNKSHGIYAE